MELINAVALVTGANRGIGADVRAASRTSRHAARVRGGPRSLVAQRAISGHRAYILT